MRPARRTLGATLAIASATPLRGSGHQREPHPIEEADPHEEHDDPEGDPRRHLTALRRARRASWSPRASAVRRSSLVRTRVRLDDPGRRSWRSRIRQRGCQERRGETEGRSRFAGRLVRPSPRLSPGPPPMVWSVSPTCFISTSFAASKLGVRRRTHAPFRRGPARPRPPLARRAQDHRRAPRSRRLPAAHDVPSPGPASPALHPAPADAITRPRFLQGRIGCRSGPGPVRPNAQKNPAAGPRRPRPGSASLSVLLDG